MRNNFLTGLVILLPIALTFWIVSLFLNLLTNPFVGVVDGIFEHLQILNKQFLFFSGHELLLFTSRLLILLGLVGLTFLIGFLARHFFLSKLMGWGDWVIHRIPLVNKVYKASQDVVHTLFSEEKTSFSEVVLVPFPHSKGLSIGLITTDHQSADRLSVFVPGTPNPTMGFMLLYRRDQMIKTDLKVDEALKFVVSCGVIVKKD